MFNENKSIFVTEGRWEEEESEAKVSTFPHILLVYQHTRNKQNTLAIWSFRKKCWLEDNYNCCKYYSPRRQSKSWMRAWNGGKKCSCSSSLLIILKYASEKTLLVVYKTIYTKNVFLRFWNLQPTSVSCQKRISNFTIYALYTSFLSSLGGTR